MFFTQQDGALNVDFFLNCNNLQKSIPLIFKVVQHRSLPWILWLKFNIILCQSVYAEEDVEKESMFLRHPVFYCYELFSFVTVRVCCCSFLRRELIAELWSILINFCSAYFPSLHAWLQLLRVVVTRWKRPLHCPHEGYRVALIPTNRAK